MIELIAKDNNESIQYKGKCKLVINFLSKVLLVEPVNEKFKMISAMFKWDLVAAKNILFVFAEHSFQDFALIFDNTRKCKKVYEVLLKNEVTPADKKLIKERLLSPLFHEISINNDSNSKMKVVLYKWIEQHEGKEKQEFYQFLKDNNIYEVIYSEKIRRNCQKQNVDGNCKKDESRRYKTDIHDGADRSKLVIFTTIEKTMCYEYFWERNGKVFQCSRCLKNRKYIAAKLCQNSDGSNYLKISRKKHVCIPRKYIPEKYEVFEEAVESSNYKIFKYLHKGEMTSRLVVFNSTNKKLCYEYFKNNFSHRYCCTYCPMENHVTATVSENGTVQLSKTQHVCALREFDPEKYKNDVIVKKPQYSITSTALQKDNVLTIFTSEERKLFYIFYYSAQKKQYYCSKCFRLRSYIYATIENEGKQNEFVYLSNERHLCKPLEYFELTNGNIIMSPNFQFLKRRVRGRVNQNLVVFTNDEKVNALNTLGIHVGIITSVIHAHIAINVMFMQDLSKMMKAKKKLLDAVMNYLPAYYRNAQNQLINSVRATADIEEKKKLYDAYSQKYTMSCELWEKRIVLELPPEGETITKEIFDICIKLRKKATKHFHGLRYFPPRLQQLCDEEKMPKLVKVYQFRRVKLEEVFPSVGSCKKIEPFLSFPHSQLSRFYRHYQLNSGKPLPADIKDKYDKAVESYLQMITVAMKPYEWIEWMESNFDEEDWVANFECKLAEHFYMKEIWFAYIKFLHQQITTDVLDVYKRYCRIFVNDFEMRRKYWKKFMKFKTDDVLTWNLDQYEFDVQFCRPFGPEFCVLLRAGSRFINSCNTAALKYLLKRCSSKMCKECFEIKNQRYFDGKLKLEKLMKSRFWKLKKPTNECHLCGESLKVKEDSNDGITTQEKEVVTETSLSICPIRTIKVYPVVNIQLHENPIPLSIFYYVLQNHQILSKIYAASKYCFLKERVLLCYRIYISSDPKETCMEQALFTNFKTILKSPIRKYCCGTTLSFKDSTNPNLLSKCLPKLCCCSLKNLVVDGQNLTVNEFKYLLQSGKMEHVDLKEVRIFKRNKK